MKRTQVVVLTILVLSMSVLGCSRTPPESGARAAASQDHVAVSKQIINSVARDIEKLKPKYEELVGFSVAACVKDGHLSLYYGKNIVEGALVTQLGRGKACEIVVKFSPVVDRGASPIPWGNYEIVYPKLAWQVSSFPACYWIPGRPGDHYTARFGGMFVRSHNLGLCMEVNEIVRTYLKELESLEKKKSL